MNFIYSWRGGVKREGEKAKGEGRRVTDMVYVEIFLQVSPHYERRSGLSWRARDCRLWPASFFTLA